MNLMTLSRPVTPRARRIAVITASVPELTNRTLSIESKAETTLSANCVSRPVGIPSLVPRDITVEEATTAARLVILNRLAVIRRELGTLDDVTRIVSLQGFVNSAPDFYAHPAVINGASDLLVEIFGELGSHSRIALGAAALPLNAAVEISLVVEVA